MFYLRVVNNKVHWDCSAERPKWLPDEQVDAHLLRDIYPAEGGLSLYEVKDEEQAELAAIAIASGRENLRRIDYFLVPKEKIVGLNFKLEREEGKTPSAEVNKLHVDLINFTARQAAHLAEAIYYCKELKLKEIPKKDVKCKIAAAIEKKLLDPKRFPERLRKEFISLQ